MKDPFSNSSDVMGLGPKLHKTNVLITPFKPCGVVHQFDYELAMWYKKSHFMGFYGPLRGDVIGIPSSRAKCRKIRETKKSDSVWF